MATTVKTSKGLCMCVSCTSPSRNRSTKTHHMSVTQIRILFIFSLFTTASDAIWIMSMFHGLTLCSFSFDAQSACLWPLYTWISFSRSSYILGIENKCDVTTMQDLHCQGAGLQEKWGQNSFSLSSPSLSLKTFSISTQWCTNLCLGKMFWRWQVSQSFKQLNKWNFWTKSQMAKTHVNKYPQNM